MSTDAVDTRVAYTELLDKVEALTVQRDKAVADLAIAKRAFNGAATEAMQQFADFLFNDSHARQQWTREELIQDIRECNAEVDDPFKIPLPQSYYEVSWREVHEVTVERNRRVLAASPEEAIQIATDDDWQEPDEDDIRSAYDHEFVRLSTWSEPEAEEVS